jgi:PhnB protein
MEVTVPPLTPYLIFSNAAEAIEFYKNAFGATQDGVSHMMPGTDKIMHARLIINGAMIMISDDFGPSRGEIAEDPLALGGSPIMLALQLDDVQSFWDQAVAAGATVTMPLADQFWGDRYGQITDPYGHKWSMSQTIVAMSDEDMQQGALRAFDVTQDAPAPPTQGGLQPSDDWGSN